MFQNIVLDATRHLLTQISQTSEWADYCLFRSWPGLPTSEMLTFLLSVSKQCLSLHTSDANPDSPKPQNGLVIVILGAGSE